jgi:hypothetical protein
MKTAELVTLIVAGTSLLGTLLVVILNIAVFRKQELIKRQLDKGLFENQTVFAHDHENQAKTLETVFDKLKHLQGECNGLFHGSAKPKNIADEVGNIAMLNGEYRTYLSVRAPYMADPMLLEQLWRIPSLVTSIIVLYQAWNMEMSDEVIGGVVNSNPTNQCQHYYASVQKCLEEINGLSAEIEAAIRQILKGSSLT